LLTEGLREGVAADIRLGCDGEGVEEDIRLLGDVSPPWWSDCRLLADCRLLTSACSDGLRPVAPAITMPSHSAERFGLGM